MPTRLAAPLLIVAACAASLPAWAVLPDAPRPRPQVRPSAEQLEAARRAEAERKAREARLATLVVRSDHACTLFIDGRRVADLLPDAPHTLTAPAGEQYVDCLSSEFPGVRHASVFTSKPQEKLTLGISLADGVAAARAQQAAVARSEAERRAAAEAAWLAASRKAAGMVPDGQGGLADPRSGLTWTVQDNGDDVSGTEAAAWCAALGDGWRLPLADELEALVDRSGAAVTRCGGARCKVSVHFRLTEAFFWSGEPAGAGSQWSVGLGGSGRDAQPQERRDGQRALCVRGGAAPTAAAR